MKLVDVEGATLPIGEDGEIKEFDISLFSDDGGILLLFIPFVVNMGDQYYNENGEHVLSVQLEDVLNEYLQVTKNLDGERGLIPLSKLLREYADKYESAANKSD